MTVNRAGRTTRRSVLRLMGAGAAAGLLPACSADEDGRTVSWQAIPSYSLQGTDPKRVGYLREQRAAYEAESGYRLDPQVTVSDTSAAMAKLLLQASQHRAPDISQVDGYVFGRTARYARTIDRHLAAAGLRLDDWFPSLRAVMTGGGDRVRGLQFTTDVRVLYYRRDLVPRPPATWEELLSIVRPLAARGQYFTFPAGRSEGAVNTTLWPQYWAQGADLFTSSGEPAFGSGRGYDAMRNALRVVRQLIDSGASPDRVATFGSEDNQNADVVAGRVAMFIGGNWQAAALNNLLPRKDFFTRFGVAPIPSISGERHVTSAGGWVWGGFTADDRTLDAGIDWVMRTYVSDSGMARWCSLGGYLPPRQSVYDHPQYQKNPFSPVFREHLATYSRGRPSTRKYLEVSNSMQIALSSVAAGDAGPDQALDDALNRLT
jgi:multiple sugar transport system substrate-binding protein